MKKPEKDDCRETNCEDGESSRDSILYQNQLDDPKVLNLLYQQELTDEEVWLLVFVYYFHSTSCDNMCWSVPCPEAVADPGFPVGGRGPRRGGLDS